MHGRTIETALTGNLPKRESSPAGSSLFLQLIRSVTPHDGREAGGKVDVLR